MLEIVTALKATVYRPDAEPRATVESSRAMLRQCGEQFAGEGRTVALPHLK